jgi:hypothetical protein
MDDSARLELKAKARLAQTSPAAKSPLSAALDREHRTRVSHRGYVCTAARCIPSPCNFFRSPPAWRPHGMGPDGQPPSRQPPQARLRGPPLQRRGFREPHSSVPLPSFSSSLRAPCSLLLFFFPSPLSCTVIWTTTI